MFEWKERTACLSHFDANRQKEAYALPLGQKAVGHGKTIHKVHNELKLEKIMQSAIFCLNCATRCLLPILYDYWTTVQMGRSAVLILFSVSTCV